MWTNDYISHSGVQLLKFEVISTSADNYLFTSKWHQNSVEAADYLTELKVESKGKHGWRKNNEL